MAVYLSKMAATIVGPNRIRPNHCGRHLGKINGHNSTYVKVWRCTFGRITLVLMGKSWGKLL